MKKIHRDLKMEKYFFKRFTLTVLVAILRVPLFAPVAESIFICDGCKGRDIKNCVYDSVLSIHREDNFLY